MKSQYWMDVWRRLPDFGNDDAIREMQKREQERDEALRVYTKCVDAVNAAEGRIENDISDTWTPEEIALALWPGANNADVRRRAIQACKRNQRSFRAKFGNESIPRCLRRSVMFLKSTS